MFEEYKVTTADGYILSVYRIKSQEFTEPGAPVVFFQHGLLSCATTWVIHYPDIAPAFQMVRNGYDVWLGNNRGTTFSRAHVSLNPDKDRAYWQYSFPELGDFDAPAQIDFVRKMTGVEKLTYIGHSQGTTQMFYALATDHDFWEKRLNLFVALAPVVGLSNTDSKFIKWLSHLDGVL